MFPFIPFPKIAERIGDWGCDVAATRALHKLTWVATEKVHGANLCIGCDGAVVVVGGRRDWLKPDQGFFDYRGAVGPLFGAVRALHAALSAQRNALRVHVFGELYGGAYPHPDVAACDGVQPVQTGIYYAPDVRFAAFDVVIVTARDVQFLPYQDAETSLRAAGFEVVPRLALGKLEAMVALPRAFDTRLPAVVGLPPLSDNEAEGFVVRPWNAAPRLDNKYARPLLKRKHPAFAETGRYHRATPWAVASPRDPIGEAEARTVSMLTSNRLAAARSKVGPDNRDALVRELTDDVWTTLEERHGALVLALPPEDRSLLWSVVQDRAAGAVESAQAASELDDERYNVALALAFIRGRLDTDGPPHELVTQARDAGLSLHKFKRKSGPPRVTRVLSLLRGLAPATLLDIGSGRGAFLWPLLSDYPELPVHAVDIAPHRVRDIEAVRSGGIANLRGVEADVTALPFSADTFDVITVLEVLEHLADPATAAVEVLRVAKRFVLASVPSHEDDNPEHIRLFTKASLDALFRDAGATNVRIEFVRNHMVAQVTP